MNRRSFLGYCLLGSWSFVNGIWGREGFKEACFYSRDNGIITCRLCPHECRLSEGQSGLCRVRRHIHGQLVNTSYSEICALHIDPIEKKPFYHFYPGRLAFSLASAGCNLRCRYCQNWEISQATPAETQSETWLPEKLVKTSHEREIPIVAFTYTEPVVSYEYLRDVATLSKKHGLHTALISAGYIQPTPLQELLPLLSAVKIDLKGFTENFYQKICGGKLEPVLRNLEIIKNSGCWLEIVYLVIPGMNDSDKEIGSMARWVAQNLGIDTPLHISRFYPNFQMKDFPPTPLKTIENACSIAQSEGVRYVYAGNITGHHNENTFCPICGKLLIQRYGYAVLQQNLQGNQCPQCQHTIAGIWND